jgi:hypothetical protein
MKTRLALQFLAVLITLNFLSMKLSAQVTPKKLIYVGSVGSAPPPVTSSSIFKVPAGVTIALSSSPGSISGTIYVADPQNNQIVAFPPGGSSTLFSTLTCPNSVPGCVVNPWPLNVPTFVAAAPNGNVWISDTGNDVVLEMDPTGTVVAFAGVGPSNVVCGGGCPPHPNSGQGNGQFFGPGPLAVDGATGNLIVADAAGRILLGNQPVPPANIRIQEFTSGGAFLTTWGSFCELKADGTQSAGSCNTSAPGAVALGDGQFAFVAGIAVDNSSQIYVAEEVNNRVQKFNSSGTFILKWGGPPQSGGTGDGQFDVGGPGGLAVDLDQGIYVVDTGNNRIELFDSSGTFISKGGSNGTAEAQFDRPFAIAAVPPAAALLCALIPDPDCEHGFVISEFGQHGGTSGNTRVQVVAGRVDTDNDGITDDVDTQPAAPSTDFSDASLGFTTFGTVTSPGDQTFAIYNEFTPSLADQIRIRTETFGGATPMTILLCGVATLSFPAGSGANVDCSTPTVADEFGPVGFQFTGSDGTVATGTLNTADSISFNSQTSSIESNAGNIVVVVGGKNILLKPGQTGFADSTPPTTTATLSPTPSASQWNNTNVLVTLNATDNPGGSGVNDITYSLSGAQTGSNVMPGNTASVPISTEGVTTLNYFSTDNAGNQESEKSVTVRIDKTPPTLLCSATPATLWPPNHKLVPVNLSVTVLDSLSGPGAFVLKSVTSNGNAAQEIEGFTVGTSSTSGLLRADKGAVYTFVYTGTDLAGNQGSCTVNVTVPHDQGN